MRVAAQVMQLPLLGSQATNSHHLTTVGIQLYQSHAEQQAMPIT